MAYIPPNDASAVFAIIALVSDPQAAATRLKELQVMSDQALTAAEESSAHLREIVAHKKTFEEDRATLALERARFDEFYAEESKRLTIWADKLSSRDKALAAAETAYENTNSALLADKARLDKDIDAFARRSKNRSEELQAREEGLAKSSKELAARLSQLKALAG